MILCSRGAVAFRQCSKMPAVVRIGDIRSDLITFAVDDRLNFSGDQWRSLYLASDDQRYLVPTSFPGYTIIGKGVFMLATRFARGKDRATSFVRDVADFLVYARRPLFRFLVYVGDMDDVERDGPRMRMPYVAPEDAFRGSESVWGSLPLIDGVKTVPPVQIGVPSRWVDRLWRRYTAELPVIWYKMNRSVVIQRRHIVLEMKNGTPILALSGAARVALSVGGRMETCGFFGVRAFRFRHDVRVYASYGMVLGKNEFAVGPFGSLLVRGVALKCIDILKAAKSPINVAIPHSVVPIWERRELWPLEPSHRGEPQAVDPSLIRGGSDVLSGGIRHYVDHQGDEVVFLSYRDSHLADERDITSRSFGDSDVSTGDYADHHTAALAARRKSNGAYTAACEWAERFARRYEREDADRRRRVRVSGRERPGSSRPVLVVDLSPDRLSAQDEPRGGVDDRRRSQRSDITVSRSPTERGASSEVKKRRICTPSPDDRRDMSSGSSAAKGDDDVLTVEPHPKDLFSASSPKDNAPLEVLDSELEEDVQPSGSGVSESLLDSDNEDELPPHLVSADIDLRASLEKNRKPDLRAKLDAKAVVSMVKEDLKMSSSSSSASGSGDSSDEDACLRRVARKCVAAYEKSLLVDSPTRGVCSPKREVRVSSPVPKVGAPEVPAIEKVASVASGPAALSADKLEKLEKRMSGGEKKSASEKKPSGKSEKRRSGSKK